MTIARYFLFIHIPVFHHVGGVQKGGPLKANLYKRRLHSGKNPNHFSFVNISDHSLIAHPFDI